MADRKVQSMLRGRRGEAFREVIGFLCKIFWGPTEPICHFLVSGRWREAFSPLAGLCDSKLIRGLDEMTQRLAAFSDAESLLETLESDYVRLFVSHRGGVAAPLYHSCYVGDEGLLMGEPARWMKHRLDAHGLGLGRDFHEPPDHLAVQLEFLFFLLGKPEAWEEALGFAGHIVPWVSELRDRVLGASGAGFYAAAASLLVDVLTCLTEQIQTTSRL